MRDDSEVAAIKATDKVLSSSVITGHKSHFRQCLWRQPQNVGLTVEYKEDKKSPTDMQNACCFDITNYRKTTEGNMLLYMKILHGIGN